MSNAYAGHEGLRCVERAVALTPAGVLRTVVTGATGPLGAASFGVPGCRRANTLVCAAS